MSEIGLNLGYTVKYTPLPSGVPSGTPFGEGLYLTVYPSSRPNTDTVSIRGKKKKKCLTITTEVCTMTLLCSQDLLDSVLNM